MDATPTTQRSPQHQPFLALFATIGSAWVFVLVLLGAFTTSIGAGMIFPDWPLSNGSLNPTGWLENVAMFAEHSHRLSAGVMSAITIVLAIWISRTETRPWLRRLAWFGVGLVLAQALIGGLRVLLDRYHLEAWETTVGRLFAMAHAVLAQLFVCTLIAVAVACTRAWRENRVGLGDRVRRIGIVCCVLLFAQLAIAAVMRHSGAGLAIPTFPYSTADAQWLPASWDFRVGIHFAHRVMAVALAVALPILALAIRRDPASTLALRTGASALVSFIVLQFLLGAGVIYTGRQASMTTAHVVVGALTLATAFLLTWVAHRDRIEAPR